MEALAEPEPKDGAQENQPAHRVAARADITNLMTNAAVRVA